MLDVEVFPGPFRLTNGNTSNTENNMKNKSASNVVILSIYRSIPCTGIFCIFPKIRYTAASFQSVAESEWEVFRGSSAVERSTVVRVYVVYSFVYARYTNLRRSCRVLEKGGIKEAEKTS